MEKIHALFWDVGGVLLSNAWDHTERKQAIDRFGLDQTDFETRHQQAVARFEEGKLSLDGYLEETVFHCPRAFSRDEFRDFMFALSEPRPEILKLARRLSRKYLMATINNESRELNEFRIRRFALGKYFPLFVSSCYVGIRKPDEKIFQLALDLTQQTPERCCFLDDRSLNLEGARRLGMRAVLVVGPRELEEELKALGVKS